MRAEAQAATRPGESSFFPRMSDFGPGILPPQLEDAEKYTTIRRPGARADVPAIRFVFWAYTPLRGVCRPKNTNGPGGPLSGRAGVREPPQAVRAEKKIFGARKKSAKTPIIPVPPSVPPLHYVKVCEIV